MFLSCSFHTNHAMIEIIKNKILPYFSYESPSHTHLLFYAYFPSLLVVEGDLDCTINSKLKPRGRGAVYPHSPFSHRLTSFNRLIIDY